MDYKKDELEEKFIKSADNCVRHTILALITAIAVWLWQTKIAIFIFSISMILLVLNVLTVWVFYRELKKASDKSKEQN
ncbi:MAG: hypothetical protein [Bacteriophage sp.]|nr:MAG: hypothetical protein [Bacteriophage sp.]